MTVDNVFEFNRRVLLVDDTEQIHEDYRKVLGAIGKDESSELASRRTALFGDDKPVAAARPSLELDSAFQGQEALDKVTEAMAIERPYAMAFVDVRMPPGWDGIETVRRIWQVDSRLEVVFCTAYSDYQWDDVLKLLGQSDRMLILKKPFDSVEVQQLAAALTEKWNLARKAQLQIDEMEEIIARRTEEIERSQQETESLLSSISSVLVGIDPSGTVHRWNAAAESLFGVPALEAIGSRFDDLGIEWVNPKAAEEFFQVADSGVSARQELKLRRADSVRVIGASRYPVSNQGEYRGFLCLGTDITDQCELERQLQQAQKLEAVGQLAAGVAHEINTPMQYLGDNLEFLQRKVDKLEPVITDVVKLVAAGGDAEKSAERIAAMGENAKQAKLGSLLGQVSEAIGDSRDGVKHVSRIVRAMKEFAHPGQEEKAPVDINRALESTIAVSTNEWKYVADVKTDFDASIPLVPAFAGELNQVFLNIVVNAAHAIGETNGSGSSGKGTITISTREVSDCVEVAISDTGGGIPEKVKQRIFDPFFTTKEVGKGTGQGLAIAYSVVVQKLGGKLWCDSKVGAGTTFFIQLPTEPLPDEAVESVVASDCLA